jgi:hypothetical protein
MTRRILGVIWIFLMVGVLTWATEGYPQQRHGGGMHQGGGGQHWSGGGGGNNWHGDGGHWSNGGWGHHNDDFAGGILGGIIGGAIGGIFAPDPEPPVVYVPVQPAPQAAPALVPWTPEWVYFCSHRYKSFNPQDGMFTGYDGIRYLCHQ